MKRKVVHFVPLSCSDKIREESQFGCGPGALGSWFCLEGVFWDCQGMLMLIGQRCASMFLSWSRQGVIIDSLIHLFFDSSLDIG